MVLSQVVYYDSNTKVIKSQTGPWFLLAAMCDLGGYGGDTYKVSRENI